MTNRSMLVITHLTAVLVGYLVGAKKVQTDREDHSDELIFVAGIAKTEVEGTIVELDEWRTFLALDQQGNPFTCQRVTLQMTKGHEVYWVPRGHTLEKGVQVILVMNGFHSNHMNPVAEQEGVQLP